MKQRLLSTLRALTKLERLDPKRLDGARATLEAALTRVAELADTDGARSDKLAELLAQALTFHSTYEGDCPVCGAEFPTNWAHHTRAAIEQAKALASEVRTANKELRAADRALRGLLHQVPPALRAAAQRALPGVTLQTLTATALGLWEGWAEAPNEVVGELVDLGTSVVELVTVDVAGSSVMAFAVDAVGQGATTFTWVE